MRRRTGRALMIGGMMAGLLGIAFVGCSGQEEKTDVAVPAEEPRADGRMVGELERLGPEGMDYLVLGVDAPGFEDLTPKQKALSYYLYRAAIAGDRMFTDQSHRYALEIQNLMEAIYLNSEGLDSGVKDAVHDYLKYLWINHGQYHADSHDKILPRTLTFEMLQRAARFAAEKGADLGAGPAGTDEELDAKLERLRPHIFDPQTDPLQVNQSPSEDQDILSGSAVNLYDPGITMEMFDGLDMKWKEKLNVRFALEKGKIVPQVYKAGGQYGKDIETILFFLEKTVPLAESEEQKAGLESLIEYYRTGEEESFRQYSIHWLNSETTVDYLNGFIEQYDDPRGVIGQYEANVSYVADSTLLGKLADSAAYFEERMPWRNKYKRTEIKRPVANVVNVVVETGDAGPSSPAAYNLPNYNDIRRDHGSKNIILDNIEGTRSPRIQNAIYDEFYLPKYRDVVRKHYDAGRKWLVYMHEVIGHGSGQPEPDLEADPRTLIGGAYSSLEECRSDLVALYHIFDDKLVEMGAFSAEDRDDIALATYIGYLQGHMVRYRSIPSDTIREAHRRGQELVLEFLTQGGTEGRGNYGVSIVQEKGDYFVDITDLKRARAGVGALLVTLQGIKSQGQADAATNLFERMGTNLDPKIRENIVARAAKLKIPKSRVFVFPRLEPVVTDGEVTDATIHFDEDLTTQQLRFSRMRFSTEIPAG